MYPSHLGFSRRGLLTQRWENAPSAYSSNLESRIMQAAEDVYYNKIEIFDVYINGECHETLIISVDPSSLSWERGYALAMRCKAVLEEYNVHCEIQESVVVSL